MAVPMNPSRADKKQPAALRKTAKLPRPFLPSAAALHREETKKAATVNPMNKDKIKVDKNKQTEIMQSVYAKARTKIADVVLSDGAPGRDLDLSAAYRRSTNLLGDYVTLDWQHRNDIVRIIAVIRQYAEDRTRNRPLNIVMQAEPGSGKSHFVRCLARKLENYHTSSVDFNMAGLQSIDDLLQPLDAIRNLKVMDRLPILFLDEFDSDPRRYSLLLPLMWDGELHIGHRDLKLGKLVIILAGSGKNLEEAIKKARGMQKTEMPEDAKIVDLLSRINGGELEIPPMDLREGERDRRVDKVCLTISLIQNRFGQSVEFVAWALLRFVAMSRFRYGVRSIAHLIDLVTPADENQKMIDPSRLTLPLNSVAELKSSSLAYHLITEDGPSAIIDAWRYCMECKALIRVLPEPKEESEET